MGELAASASFIGYALVGFIVAVYLPHIIFKFLAEQDVDLGGRRDITRLEEFVAAALPSVLFNVFAFVTYEFIDSLSYWLSRIPGVPRFRQGYDVDWAVVASIFADDKGMLADFVYAGELWPSVGVYFLLLYGIAAVNGRIYGAVFYDSLKQGSNLTMSELLNAPIHKWRTWKGLVGWLWHVFYHDAVVPYFQWEVRDTWVMVRTVDGRLYHGKFAHYEKTVDGSFETIQLTEVHRYCYDEIEERFARGEIAVSEFEGELHIKWSRIADINRVERETIYNIMANQYFALRDEFEGEGLPAPPVPNGLDLTDSDEEQS